jgi:iron complex outermembrane receptor protein
MTSMFVLGGRLATDLRGLLIATLLVQQTITRPVVVRHDGVPVEGAQIECAGSQATTGSDGRASVAVPPTGCVLRIAKDGFMPVDRSIEPVAGEIDVALAKRVEVEEEVVVTATRTGRLASDQALRVEVVAREEIEEKLLMTPGDIVMLLNETSGIRVQPTAPALGSASVRIQGLPGRYTPVLTDGLPLNTTQSASLGLLQIPPMDLQQVEIIKGAASALFGASALGGVINLVSKRPGDEPAGELLLNLTSREGADAVLWLERPLARSWGATLLAGAHGQNTADVDDDGWADLPRYRRGILRPRFVWTGAGSSIEAIGGVLGEERSGGSLDEAAFHQAVSTRRADAGAIWRRSVSNTVVAVRGALTATTHDHQYGLDSYSDSHQAQFGEVAITRLLSRHGVVVGFAVDRQKYENETLPAFEYDWITPAVFAQDDWTVRDNLLIALSARVDWHSDYGTFFSPRVSSLWRVADWQLRGSIGRGFFTPSALTEESEEVGLHHVAPLRDLDAESGTTVSVDATRRFGALELSATAFGGRVHDALAVEEVEAEARLHILNRREPSRTSGAELFGRFRSAPWFVTGSYAWTVATEVDFDGVRVDVPLTPTPTWSIIGGWEHERLGRVGVEIYRTGRQRLEDNPYRDESPAYTIVGLLAERRFARARVFVNFENLTDVRQSHFDPFLLPAPSSVGRRTVDAWRTGRSSWWK